MPFAEKLELVQINAANEVKSLMDLNDDDHFLIKSGSFKVVAPVLQRVESADQRRWGGSRQVGQTEENAVVSWEAGVNGESENECLQYLELLLAQLAGNPYPTFLLWQPPGAAEPTLYEMRGVGQYEPVYNDAQFGGAQLFMVQITIPVAPLAQGLPVQVLVSEQALPAVFRIADIPGDAPAKAEVSIETGQEPDLFLITGGAESFGIAVNATYLYWCNRSTGTIGRAKLNGEEVNQAFITGASDPTGIAINATYIYWANESTGDIGRATLAGGEVKQNFITGATKPQGVAVDGTYIYWGNTPGIGRALLAGTSVNQTWITGEPGFFPQGIAVNATHIYWANSLESQIGRALIGGTEKQEDWIFDAAQPKGVAVNAEYIYWTNEGANTIGRASLEGKEPNAYWLGTAGFLVRGIAVNGTNVFWTHEGKVGRAELERSPPIWALLGWAPTPTVEEQDAEAEWIGRASSPYGVASDSTYIYWTNYAAKTIGRAKLNTEDVNQNWITGADTAYGVAVNAEHVYWTNDTTNTIARATISGGSVNLSFIAGASEPRGIAIDGTYVYWVNHGTGDIGRATLSGGEINQKWITGLTSLTGIAVDRSYVYWTSLTSGYIGRATIGGAQIEEKWITGASDPEGVAVNGEYVYWTNFGKKTIGRALLNGEGVEQEWMPFAGDTYGVAATNENLYWTTGGFGNSIGHANLTLEGFPPFGLRDSFEAVAVEGWTYQTVADAWEGKALKGNSPLASAYWNVNPATMVPDSFSGELSVEVWARVLIEGNSRDAHWIVSAQPQDGLGYGASRFTDEWGSSGRQVYASPAHDPVWRLTRLGTLHLLVNPLAPRVWQIWLEGTGSGGEWGVDYLLLVPSMARSCSPSGKPLNSSYPNFIQNVGPTVKTIRHDLSALVAKPGKYGHPDHGLGGQLLEFPPGPVDLLVKCSSLIPDSPEEELPASEQLNHPAVVGVTVTPRYFLTQA